MNKIYKLKYDRRRNQLVAVSELTTGAGKEATGSVAGLSGQQDISTFRRLMGTLTPLAVMTGLVIGMLPGLALANPDLPVGGQVVAGQGSISTSGNQMTIHQNTHGLVTNWNSFDIGQNHRVQFVQPDSSAVALNRVTGGHESQILGTLTANGQVMLVNPAGVMFGKGAKVNTAGLLASTKNISTEDFMAGRYTFSGGSHPGAEIVNQGSLTTTKGGYIVLTADRVRNSGSITTPSGKTVLAAADRVTLQLDNTGLASVSVNGSVVNALVENSGLIAATNGQVYLTARGKEMLLNTVVNNSGTVEARGLNQRGGEIVLDGGDSGVVSQSGMLLADNETGRGGKITVQGANIHLTGGSRTSATGRTGGGEVYVGGGWQGKDTAIRNASKVVTDRDAVIDVSATERGDGGKAVLWSEDYTNFRGLILAKGGAQSGNGGQVETSSHNNLQAFGDVEVSALNGHGGNWLLDPTNVTIVAGADKNVGNASNVFTPSDNGAQIGVGSIQNQLNKGANVTIKTSGHDIAGQQGNITVNAVVNKTSGDDATLALLADGNIVTADRAYKDPDFISSTNGKLNLVMQAGNGGSITLGKYFKASLNGGDFTAGVNNSGGQGEGIYFNQSNGGYIKAGNITIDAPGRGYHGYAPSMTATGNLSINGKLDVSTGYGSTAEFKAGDTLKLNAPTGDIVFAATDTSNNGGRVVLSGDKGVIISTDNGGMTLKSAGGKQNSLDVTSTKGNISLNATTSGERRGVSLINANLTSTSGDLLITANGSPSMDTDDLKSSLYISGNVAIHAGRARINGYNSGTQWGAGAGVGFVNSNLSYSGGDFLINGQASSGPGIYFAGSNSINISSAVNVTYSGQAGNRNNDDYLGNAGILLSGNTYSKTVVTATVGSDGNFNLLGKGTNAPGITSGPNKYISKDNDGSLIINGSGNANVSGSSVSTEGVKLSLLDTSAVDGKVDVKGSSVSNTGVYVNGTFANTSISGESTDSAGVWLGSLSKSGVKMPANITGSGGVDVSGSSVNGDGAVFEGIIDGLNISGTSKVGSGVSVLGNSSIKSSGIHGTSMSGNGVAVTGNVTLDEATAVNLTGGSTDGSGLSLQADAAITAVQTGTTTPVTTAVQLNGTSVSGSGASTAGNVTLNGAILSGSAGDNGTGVTLSGDLTLGDALSGVSATTGNGTALNLDNVSFNATNHGSPLILNPVVTGDTGTAIKVSGDTSLINVGLNGNSSNGSGVVIDGNLATDQSVIGNTHSGTALTVAGNLVSSGGHPITGTATGRGTGVSVTGDSTLTDVVLKGTTTSGTGVSVAGSLTNAGSTMVSGGATGSGAGFHVWSGSGVTNGGLNGSSVSGPGGVFDGNNNLLNITVNGSSGSNSGLLLNGVVMSYDSSLNGQSGSSDGVSLYGTVVGGSLSGQSENGVGVHVTGNSSVSGVNIRASSENGQGLQLDGLLSTAGDTTLNGSVQGNSSAERLKVSSLQKRMSQNDRSLRQMVPSSGYREQERSVSVDICTSGPCRKLDVGMKDHPLRQ